MTWTNTPPPKPGWFVASLYRDPAFLRFWDGKAWSVGVPAHWVKRGAHVSMAGVPADADDSKKVEWLKETTA